MPKKILLIDDDPLVLKSLCMVLKKEGYEVDAISDGFDSLNKIAETEYQLIIVGCRLTSLVYEWLISSSFRPGV